MDPERHARVDEIFLAACDVEPPERGEFVASACGGDELLRAEAVEVRRQSYWAAFIESGASAGRDEG